MFKNVLRVQRLQQVNENTVEGTEERRVLDSGTMINFYKWLRKPDDVPDDPLEKESQEKRRSRLHDR